MTPIQRVMYDRRIHDATHQSISNKERDALRDLLVRKGYTVRTGPPGELPKGLHSIVLFDGYGPNHLWLWASYVSHYASVKFLPAEDGEEKIQVEAVLSANPRITVYVNEKMPDLPRWQVQLVDDNNRQYMLDVEGETAEVAFAKAEKATGHCALTVRGDV